MLSSRSSGRRPLCLDRLLRPPLPFAPHRLAESLRCRRARGVPDGQAALHIRRLDSIGSLRLGRTRFLRSCRRERCDSRACWHATPHFVTLYSVRLLRFAYGSADLMTAWVVHKGDEGATPGLMHARWDEGERWPLGDWPGGGVSDWRPLCPASATTACADTPARPMHVRTTPAPDCQAGTPASCVRLRRYPSARPRSLAPRRWARTTCRGNGSSPGSGFDGARWRRGSGGPTPAIESTSRMAVPSACTKGWHGPAARASSRPCGAGASPDDVRGHSMVSASSIAQPGIKAPASVRYACQPDRDRLGSVHRAMGSCRHRRSTAHGIWTAC